MDRTMNEGQVQDVNFANLRTEYNRLRIKYKELQADNDEVNGQLSAELLENNRLIAAVEKAKCRAEESDILKSNFLANMSHELRTPMNGIMGFAQLLKGEEDRERLDRYIDIIYHNGVVLVNLIDDIIDISKIDTGQLAIKKSNCNIDDLMFELYTFFNELKFKQEKEHINIRLLNLNDDDGSCILFTDEQRLRQVLTNLIGNAIKFTEVGNVDFGYIIKVEEKVIQFFVRDTGIGISENKRDIIFERFRQGQEGSTRKYGGTGIGLYISKCIINMLGGNIWFDTKEGEGTTFYFSLPFVDFTNLLDGVAYSTEIKTYDWSDKTILVAEDVETNYKYVKTVLADTLASVLWAHNGKEAVDAASSRHIDLILMDIQMPIMDGYEASSIIKGKYPDIPIIAQTAFALPHDNIRCFEAGCNDYIAKPINADLLKQKMNQYLDVFVKTD